MWRICLHLCLQSCDGCDADGPDNCLKCAEGYSLKNNFCVTDKTADKGDITDCPSNLWVVHLAWMLGWSWVLDVVGCDRATLPYTDAHYAVAVCTVKFSCSSIYVM